MNISSGQGNNNNMNYGVANSNADGYGEFLEAVKERFSSIVSKGGKLFTTDVKNLFYDFLSWLPAEARQHYTCRSCKHFFERFGGLVTIDEKGVTRSVMWDEMLVPPFFRKAVREIQAYVEHSNVTGVFLSSARTLGTPINGVLFGDRTGGWEHLAVTLPLSEIHGRKILTAEQAMAEKKEDFKMLNNALLEYSVATVETAVNLLKTESLYRSEKTLGVAEWFLALNKKWSKSNVFRRKENMVWLAVATAPTGFTHVRSSMIGTLLDDIASGMNFESVSRRFAEKMNPLQYQRPQSAPSAGNIARAEVLIKELGYEKSLERRFARVEELETIWKPRGTKKAPVRSGGVFGHLTPKEKTVGLLRGMDTPVKTMTWRKFLETVLPNAETMEYFVTERDNFSAILTAEHYDAPPIIQWDSEEQRNPFNWYVYPNGSPATTWNLVPGVYTKVTGITYQPSMWYNDNAHMGKSVFFILEDAKDNNFASRYGGSGNALFPEVLKSELREIRSTIEAYSRKARLGGYDEASACGVRLQYDSSWSAVLRVTTKMGTAVYKLDRWD